MARPNSAGASTEPVKLASRYFRCAALLVLVALCAVASLRAKELRIEKFSAEIIVSPKGEVDVTETIQAHFIGGPWHGLYRSIPVQYVTPQGFTQTLFLDIKSVRDGDGNKLKYDVSSPGKYRKLKIYLNSPDDSVRTILIEYTVPNAMRFFEDHDEFYWNITGDEWDVPIGDASARIVLPANVSNVRTNTFTGVYRSRASDATAEVVGSSVEVHTRDPLRLHEGLTVAVAFDKGAVRQPSALEKAVLFLRSNWPLLIPGLVFVLMFYLWWTRGRDPRLRPITAQYEPPNQLSPGEAGTLVDNSADMRDITASLVDLAVRGYLVIEEKQKDRMMGLVHDKDYHFIASKDRAEWAKLKPHEVVLMDGLFSTGTVGEDVAMSSLENRFYKNLPTLKAKIFESLVGLGYYKRRPDSVRATYVGAGIAVGFLSVWGGGAISGMLAIAPQTFIVAGVLSALVICGFGWFMPAHTEAGTRALENVLGFEDFLQHVESDRFNRTIKTPQMFEKFLPYAMAFGVEKNWSHAFEGIMTQPPDWYRGGAYGPNFYPLNLTNSLSTMSDRAGSVMSSAPRSSGGSGFGGGGSSGGGGGGGGGGGF